MGAASGRGIGVVAGRSTRSLGFMFTEQISSEARPLIDAAGRLSRVRVLAS